MTDEEGRSPRSEEEIPGTPEYGFGGAAYARARKLKQKEMQAQAWHDANVAPVGTLFPVDKDAEIARLRAENERLRDELQDFIKWSEAYPTDIFIEPDFAKAHEVLTAAGMTLDAISAAVMRRTTKAIGERARAALKDAPQWSALGAAKDGEIANAREVLAAYDQLVDNLRAEIARLREALAGLVNRLDEIHADPAYKSVWTSYMIHGGRYNGPTYVEELARARAALKAAPQ